MTTWAAPRPVAAQPPSSDRGAVCDGKRRLVHPLTSLGRRGKRCGRLQGARNEARRAMRHRGAHKPPSAGVVAGGPLFAVDGLRPCTGRDSAFHPITKPLKSPGLTTGRPRAGSPG
eukprot:scaffold1009_cov375-Prasinococcus_capsulatus_cf.AAC.12